MLVYNIVTQKKTYTDFEGKFILEGKFNEELRFIKDGYERKSEIIRNISNLKIVLIKLPVEIEEVKIKHLCDSHRESLSLIINYDILCDHSPILFITLK